MVMNRECLRVLQNIASELPKEPSCYFGAIISFW